MAKWMPFRSRPSMGRSRGLVAPVQRTTASNSWSSFFAGIVGADLGVGDEVDAFGFHLGHARQHDLLLVELHVGDAIHEQAADAVGALENGDQVAGLVELGGGAEARRA